MPTIAIIVLGCVAVLVLDTLGSLLARRTGFNYTLLTPLSVAIYAATAYFAAREADVWLVGSLAGAATAATDATLGWRIPRRVGIEREDSVTEAQEARVAAVVTLGGAAIGTIAGLLA
jgi:hypothetical protein